MFLKDCTTKNMIHQFKINSLRCNVMVQLEHSVSSV